MYKPTGHVLSSKQNIQHSFYMVSLNLELFYLQKNDRLIYKNTTDTGKDETDV